MAGFCPSDLPIGGRIEITADPRKPVRVFNAAGEETFPRRTTIPAGSTPGEKEKGQWVKLTDDELRLALHFAENCAPPSWSYPDSVDKTLAAKLREASRAT